MKEIRDTPRPTMTDEEMVKDYPRLSLEYTRLHEDYRRLYHKQLHLNASSLQLRNESKSFFNVKNLADLKRLYPNGKLYTASLVDGYVKYFVDEKLVITKALIV